LRLTLSSLGDAISNLAATYSDLGRHQDALVMKEKTLEFRRRVLPENHPDICATCVLRLIDVDVEVTISALGDAMNNLAATYSALGRHQDALVMKEKTLEFRRRVLPENHPDIGATFVLRLIY
jgi:tetratricopeptide (TPR) repeat protein